MEGSNIKEIKIHETINRFNNPDSLEIGQLHKIIHKCIKEGNLSSHLLYI